MEGPLQPADEPIRIVPYDPVWPARFEEERVALAEALGEVASGGIHHVGSTAVPGLDAKPIIDILVGVEDLETPRAGFDALAGLNYLYAPYRVTEMHWFCKPDPSRRTHHLHLVPTTSARFRDELAFRDRLRSSPRLAAEYAALKHRLAAEFEHDREAYTDAKAAFIRRALGEEAPGGEAESSGGEAKPRGEVRIREAEEDDVPGIAEVHVRSWQAAYRGVLPDDLLDGLSVAEREESWRAILDEGGDRWLTLVAADAAGNLVGFCSVATPSREEKAAAEIGALYIDPHRWRQGAGSALLSATLEELSRQGWSEVILWVLPENEAALAFYDRFGFAVEKGVEKLEERSGHRVVRLRRS